MIALRDNSASLEETIRASKIRMECLVNFYERAADKEYGREAAGKIRRYRKQARKTRKRIACFNQITQNLTPEFEMVSIPANMIDPSYQRQAKNWIKHHRAKIFQRIAICQKDRLKAMGLSDEEITFMSKAGKRPLRDGLELDMTVEHVIPLSHGGTNDFDNIQIIPHHMNGVFEWFTQIQAPDNGTSHIVSLRAKTSPDDLNPYLPILPGGFRKLYGDRQTMKDRAEAVLGVKLAL